MWTALEDVWFHLKLQSRPLLFRPTVCFRSPNKLSFTTCIRRARCCVSCHSSSLQRLTARPAEGGIESERKGPPLEPRAVNGRLKICHDREILIAAPLESNMMDKDGKSGEFNVFDF